MAASFRVDVAHDGGGGSIGVLGNHLSKVLEVRAAGFWESLQTCIISRRVTCHAKSYFTKITHRCVENGWRATAEQESTTSLV